MDRAAHPIQRHPPRPLHHRRQHVTDGKFSAVSFFCDNVEKTYEELQAKGVEFDGPPEKADWGTAAIFKDPDGNRFVLSSR